MLFPEGTLIVYAWNSQGNKYNLFQYFQEQGAFALALSEAGWAPWVRDVSVYLRHAYSYSIDNNPSIDANFGATNPIYRDLSGFFGGGQLLDRDQIRLGTWWPWVAHLNADTNTRCSSAFITNARFDSENQVWPGLGPRNGRQIRQVGVHTLTGRNGGNQRKLKIVSVHLTSGDGGTALRELEEVAKDLAMTTHQTDNATCIVLGDMNIDLQVLNQFQHAQVMIPLGLQHGEYSNLTQGTDWDFVRLGSPTHTSGGELDWGFWFDPQNIGHNWAVTKKAGFNGEPCPRHTSNLDWNMNGGWSDHAVLRYQLVSNIWG